MASIEYLTGFAQSLDYYTRQVKNTSIDLEINIGKNDVPKVKKNIADLKNFLKACNSLVNEIQEGLK